MKKKDMKKMKKTKKNVKTDKEEDENEEEMMETTQGDVRSCCGGVRNRSFREQTAWCSRLVQDRWAEGGRTAGQANHDIQTDTQ